MGIPIFKELKDHIVYKNNDNQVVPSVTTILKIINKEELLHWANGLGFKRISVKKELLKSQVIGTITHDLIDKYITTEKKNLNKIREHSDPIEKVCIMNAFNSFLKYYSEEKENFSPIYNEKSISGEKWGGTIDYLAEYKNDLVLCDFKTSKSFYVTMFLQLAAYDLLLRETEGREVDKYMVILLDKKNGERAKIKVCDDKDEMQYYRDCFKKLTDFYYYFYYINQKYWNKELI